MGLSGEAPTQLLPPAQGIYRVCLPWAAQAELRGFYPPVLALCIPELCWSAGPPGRQWPEALTGNGYKK